MCRLVVYRGHGRPLLLATLLTRPTHSIIKQSLDSKLRSCPFLVLCDLTFLSGRERLISPVNGDGFGVGWYDDTGGAAAAAAAGSPAAATGVPCVFLATSPAWNNTNLHRLADHVVSSLIFAHVRAASPGLQTTESNCHPFSFGRFLWMHNGDVPAFPRVKRELLLDLPAHLFDAIQGHTDSEFWFMLFLQMLGVGDMRREAAAAQQSFSAEQLIEAMRRTLARVTQLTEAAGDARCVCNFVVTDGTTVVATRFAGPGCTPASLYYASGSGWESSGAGYVMSHRERVPYAYIIASEPLTSDAKDWVVIPAQSIAAITADSDFLILPVK